jgi:subtilisin family serine protease
MAAARFPARSRGLVRLSGAAVGFAAFMLACAGVAIAGDGGKSVLMVNGHAVAVAAEDARVAQLAADMAHRFGLEVKSAPPNPRAPLAINGSHPGLVPMIRDTVRSFFLAEELSPAGSGTRTLYLFAAASGPAAPDAGSMRSAAAAAGLRSDGAVAAGARRPVAAGSRNAGQDPAAEAFADSLPNELVVRFRGDADPEAISALHDSFGARIVRTLPQLNICRVRFPDSTDLSAARLAYQDSGLTDVLEPNYRVALPEVRPNDAEYGTQWALETIMAAEAWHFTTGSEGVLVALLDTGVDADHPDLAGNVLVGYDVLTGRAGVSRDEHGHGTQMAGIIAAQGNNGAGVAGVSWKCRILPVRVLDRHGSGSYWEVMEGLTVAVERGAQIVNMSFGGYRRALGLQEAVALAVRKNVLLVAGVGNDGRERPSYPAAYPRVLGVAASAPHDDPWQLSNRGDAVDLAAPGVGVLTTTTNGGYAYGTGTSHAAALVSGCAALLKAHEPGLSGEQMARRLQATADDRGEPGRDGVFGAGRVNVYRALAEGNAAEFSP